ncbi:MAG: phosphotransferase [Actinomycetota bacterium]
MALDVGAWRGLRLVSPVAGGHRNEVWRGDIAGTPVSVRRSRRSTESLDWELDLIEQLDAADLIVPTVVRSDDGRRHVDRVVVQQWIGGREPSIQHDWRLVADALSRVQRLPVAPTGQRPGCSTVVELTRAGRSVDADLAALPDDVAARVLAVFAEFADAPVTLIHGDPHASNLRILDDGRVGLLDFDESRVDVTWHDLSNLGVQVLDDDTHARAQRLSDAWEAANAWVVEPDYARHRLRRLADI